MDQSQNYQVQRSGLPPPSQQQQQQGSSSPSQQQLDTTPQDVLAEARKNLQVLIDSGLSKEILHQWVDDSQSLQLLFPTSTQSFALSQPSLAPQHAPPPPPPQCPPPPPPTHVPSVRLGSNAVQVVAVSGQASTATMPTVPSTDMKHETPPDDTSRTWPTPSLSPNPVTAALERTTTTVSDADASIFIPPSAPFSQSHSHRPRISISSVSSGSSGHASIWSTNSAQSSFSWHSGTTGGRSMAPLPMPPTSGLPVLNGTHVPASATSPSRQNIYWCTSCETSFKRKYDWKRHEDEFHERWRKYPCPEPGCNRSFWGSNSFNQHHKQCHGCKTCPHAEKVVKFLRKRKYWACGFCSALHPARERHVEHVARHFESGMTKGDWMHSRVVYGLLHQPLIREAWDALVNSKESEYNGRRPQFSWHPSKTGRAQGFLEKENAGQLQDMLEFFSGDEGEAQWIASSAYDLADIVLTSAPVPTSQYPGAAASMPPPPHYPQQDPHASYATLSPQPPHQPMLPSSSPNSQSQFASPFRATMFVPSQHQHFANSARPSPDPTSHSPLTASQSSQSPLAPSHSPLEHRELPQVPSSSGAGGHDGMMEYEYSSAPVVFEDWEGMAGAVVNDVTPQPPAAGSQADWGMMQYFNDPRVTS